MSRFVRAVIFVILLGLGILAWMRFPGRTSKRPQTAVQTAATSAPSAVPTVPKAARKATPPTQIVAKVVRERERERKERYDNPYAAAEWEANIRRPPGATVVPVDRYFDIQEHNDRMPQYSSALRMFLPPRGMIRRKTGSTEPPNAAEPLLAAATGSWQVLGNGTTAGRIRALLINQQSPSTMYVGGVSGGIWRTTNGGGTWSLIGTTLPNLTVGSMAMDPRSPSTIYVGTGEGTAPQNEIHGNGMFKTTDGGNNWTVLTATRSPNGNFSSVNHIIVSGVNSSHVYAATNTGVMRSLDGGNTWTVSWQYDTGCYDLLMRGDVTTDYVVASCGSNGGKGQLFVNTTAATSSTWTSVLHPNNMGYTSLAIAPSNQKIMYAMASSVAANGPYKENALLAIYRSSDGGLTWTAQNTNNGTVNISHSLLSNSMDFCAATHDAKSIDNQGDYDNVLAVDPNDPTVVWAGGIDIFKSTDSGVTWGRASDWQAEGTTFIAHSDHHALLFLNSGGALYDAGDGGVFVTNNPTGAVAKDPNGCGDNFRRTSKIAWSKLNTNLTISQFYHGVVYNNGNTFIGGAQDNGTSRGTIGNGINNWTEIAGGDGTFVAVDTTENPPFIYAPQPKGKVEVSEDGGTDFEAFTKGLVTVLNPGTNNQEEIDNDPGFEFIAPLAMDPSDPNNLWIGGKFVWRVKREVDNTWRKVFDLGSERATAITVAPGDSNKVTVGTDGGNIFFLKSGALSATLGQPWAEGTPRSGARVSSIAYDPKKINVLYATYSTFGGQHVFKSDDFGAHWTSLDGSGATGLPDVPVHSVVVSPVNNNLIFIGTDMGIYSSPDGGSNWYVETTPVAFRAQWLTLAPVNGSLYLYAFTHGSGLWRSPVTAATPCTYWLSPDIEVSAAGTTGSATLTTQSGCHWTATPNVSWISVLSGSSGTGNGSFSYRILPNSGAARNSTITVSGGGGSDDFAVDQLAASFTIAGTVLGRGAGLPGVNVALSGDATKTATTDGNGRYSFTVDAGGTYTVAAALSGWTFTPPSQQISNIAASWSVNFTGAPRPNVTVTSNPSGLTVMVGPSTYTTPANLYLTPGQQFALDTASPQDVGSTRYVWASWSDNGAQSHSITAPNSGTATYTANFTTQYQLFGQVSPPGAGTTPVNPPTSTGYYNAGTVVSITATPNSGYTFNNWTGNLTGSANPQSITMSAPKGFTANFTPTAKVTVATSPSGLPIVVDGVNYTSPQSFNNWNTGTQHTLSVPTTQTTNGVTSTFASWSDSGAQSHSVTATSTAAVYTATFNNQYQLTAAASPAAGGSVAASPAASNGFYTDGASVQLTATPTTGYAFTGWTGDLTGTANPQTLTMRGTRNVTASFSALPSTTVTTVPAGLTVIVDGQSVTSPQNFQWAPGSTHTVNVASPQGIAARSTFVSWSDGGAQSHTITATAAAATYAATFSQQYLLTLVTPTGSIAPSPTSPDGFYDPGTVVQLTAVAPMGSSFSSWSGDLSGNTNPQAITMNAPHTVTATYQTATPATITSSPAGLTVTVDGIDVITPVIVKWLPASTHTISAPSTQGSTPPYVFSGWSDGGAATHDITARTTTYTANYAVMNQLTASASPAAGGTVAFGPASATGYFASTSTVQVSAVPNQGYVFSGWSGDLTGSANPQSLNMAVAHSVTATFVPAASVTVTTNPPGLSIVVDGQTSAAPQSFNWTPGSPHTISSIGTQSASGSSYTFSAWSDTGALTHTINASASSTTYTATFTNQFQLTTTPSPAAGGSISATPPSATGLYAAGTPVQLTATPNPGYQFVGWSGDLSGSTNPQSLTMNAPHNVTATFTQLTGITVTTNPSGLSIVVDGVTLTAPQTFSWQVSSSHSISAASPQSGTGATYTFNNWSDSGAISHTVQGPGTATVYTANFTTQYQLTTAASPGAGGTLTPSPTSVNGFYPSGSSVQLTATANPGYQFAGWTGDLSGAVSPQQVTMSAARNVTATFAPVTGITVTTDPPGNQITVDGTPYTAPQNFNWPQGSSHTIGVSSPQGSGNIINSFAVWSDNGGSTHTITAPATPTVYTASFNPLYQLTTLVPVSAGGTVNVSPQSFNGGYYVTAQAVQVTATANPGYQFVGWSGDLSGSTASQSLTMAQPRSVTANFAAVVPVTVTSVPAGLSVFVDGSPIATPQTFQWLVGSQHALSVSSPQAQGLTGQQTFSGWSDGGSVSHSVTVGSSPSTYSATFGMEYLLTAAPGGTGTGTISPNPFTIDGFYPAGTVVQLTATGTAGSQFSNWSGDLAGATNPQAITMNAAHTVAANFVAPVPITIQTAPLGASVTVDGAVVQTPQVFFWLPGSLHSVNANQLQGTAQRYTFSSWSDGGAQSHNITAPGAAATYTATFGAQYQLSTTVTPAGSGTITATPSSPDGYYNVGTVVQLTASASSGFSFGGWSGDVVGSTTLQSITMDGPHSATANFSISSTTSGLAFYPITPCRVVDTRGATGTFAGPVMAGGSTRTFPVQASTCGVPANATAYAFNVTVIPQAGLGFLTAWPAGQSQPNVSTLNSPSGAIVANAAIVPAGTGGAVNVFVTDTTHVIIDVNGYFAPPGTQGLAFYSLTPCRVADTRGGQGTFGGPRLAAGAARNFPMPSSACGIPANAQAYSLNMTVVPPGPMGYLTTWPAGQTQPVVSTLNAYDGRIAANAAIVPAGAGGAISVFVSDPTDLIIDVNGYFAPPGSPGALYFNPAVPCRVADTRNAAGSFGGPILSGGSTRNFPVPSSACSIPANAQAYSLNVTVVPPGPLNYLTTWPTGSPQPNVSTLNSFNGQIVANAAIVPAGTGGAIGVFVSDASQVILDINGYFAPPGN